MEGTDGRLGLCNPYAPFYKAGCGHVPVPISEIQVHPESADIANEHDMVQESCKTAASLDE
jgi:hypothetical protein